MVAGAVFFSSDDAFDKTFFDVKGPSVQPIVKKVDPVSIAEISGLAPGDVVVSVNGVRGLSNLLLVEMLRTKAGEFRLVVFSGKLVQQQVQSAR